MKDKYLQEFQKSAISEEIINLNFKAVEGDRIYDYLAIGCKERLNGGRLPQSWLNTYKHCEKGGWFCGGIDLITFEDNEWGCFKPEFPRYNEYGLKTIKYEHPKGYPSDVFALKVGTEAIQLINERYKTEFEPDLFWQQVIANKNVPVIITEGAKKAASLLSHGYIAIALPGVNGGYRSGLKETHGLIPSLVELAGRKIFFAFDKDEKIETRFKVERAMATTTTALNRFGCECFSLKWPDTFKGVDDFLVVNGGLAFEDVIKKATLVKTEKKNLKDAVSILFEKGLSGSSLAVEIAAIAIANLQPVTVVRAIYDEIEREHNLRESRDEVFSELLDLIAVESTRLNLNEFIPKELAGPLTQIADCLGSTPEAMLFTLLPTIAACVSPDFELELYKQTNFYAKPIFWAGIIGESTNGKTPTMNCIINPYRRLQYEEEVTQRAKIEAYDEELRAWKKLSKQDQKDNDEPTPPPPPREYFVQDYTSEALAKIQTDQPNFGLLIPIDELAGLIKSNNAYRGGKGSDAEKLLSARSGEPIKVNRADGKRLCSPRSTFSIIGGIQPEILKQQMGDGGDVSGHFGRFAWCLLPILASEIKEGVIIPDVNERLYFAYQKLGILEGKRLYLSPKANERFVKYFNELDKLRVSTTNSAMRVVYGKNKQQVGEIALLLYLLWVAYYEQEIEPQIPEWAMAAAVNLSKFAISQVRSFHTKARPDGLTQIMAYVIELSRKKGAIAARDVVQAGKKESPEKLREIFKELETMGIGQTIGSGIRLRYSYNRIVEDLETVEPIVDKTVESQNLDTVSNTEIQTPIVETVETIPSIPEVITVATDVITNEAPESDDSTVQTISEIKPKTVTTQEIEVSTVSSTDDLQTENESTVEFKVGDRVSHEAFPNDILEVTKVMEDGWVNCYHSHWKSNERCHASELTLVPSS